MKEEPAALSGLDGSLNGASSVAPNRTVCMLHPFSEGGWQSNLTNRPRCGGAVLSEIGRLGIPL